MTSSRQLAARVSPTLVDLLAAAATGLAEAFAVARRDVGDILPGVAIAISLVPPLAVVGVTAAAGDLDDALGALLLYLTNVLAIIVVGIVLFSSLRVAQGHLRDARFRVRRVLVIVGVGAIVVVVALSVLTARTVELSNQLSAATSVASDWARRHGERVVNARFDGTTLVLLVEGTTNGARDPELLNLLDGAVPTGTDVVVNRVPGRRNDVGACGSEAT